MSPSELEFMPGKGTKNVRFGDMSHYMSEVEHLPTDSSPDVARVTQQANVQS